MKNNQKSKFIWGLIPVGLLITILAFLSVWSPSKVEKKVELKQPTIVKEKSETTTFVAFGDSGTGSSEQKQLATLMEGYNPNFIIHTGDLAYPVGSFENIKSNVLDIYSKLFAKSVFYPSLGNHDYMTESGKPFVETFDLPGNERYYSFEIGKALFIALDSNKPLDENPNQMITWLEKLLSKSQSRFKVVYFHHPPYSSGAIHGSDQRVQEKLVPIFEKYKVDLVLSGHEHNYQRTCKILSGSCDEKGIQYIVTGGGGAPLYSLGKEQWFTKVQKSLHHFIFGQLSNCQIDLKAIDINNEVFDTLDIKKC
jgi:predicted MPP superfamily phosphohydrolase